MKKWKTWQHHLSKKAFLRWEAVQLDQEGWDPGRCIFARRGFFHLVAENILWEKTFREVLDQNLVKAVLLRCIETISGGGCYIIHITLEKTFLYHLGWYCETQPPASIGWVALSSVVRLFVCPSRIVTPHLISTIWCFRPYKPYIFCEDMILATCQWHSLLSWAQFTVVY